MLKVLLVGLGGFVGAVARYTVSGLVHRYYPGSFPLGTLTVNVVGCLFIGALMSLVEDRSYLSPETRTFVIIGLLGSFTTFSTVAYEAFEMLRDQQLGAALGNWTANVALGLVAVWAGRALAHGAGI
jgi:CrcB protein